MRWLLAASVWVGGQFKDSAHGLLGERAGYEKEVTQRRMLACTES